MKTVDINLLLFIVQFHFLIFQKFLTVNRYNIHYFILFIFYLHRKSEHLFYMVLTIILVCSDYNLAG